MTALIEQKSGQDINDATQIRLETSNRWSTSTILTPPQFAALVEESGI